MRSLLCFFAHIIDLSLERKKRSCQFLMQLKEERMLSQSAIMMLLRVAKVWF